MVCAMVRPRYSVRPGGGAAGGGTAAGAGAGACPNARTVTTARVGKKTAKFREIFEQAVMRIIAFIKRLSCKPSHTKCARKERKEVSTNSPILMHASSRPSLDTCR